MSDTALWMVAVVGGELLLLLLVFLGIAFFRHRAAAKRDAKAMKALVARVKKGKATREQALEAFLQERVGLDGDALVQARGALMTAQMGLLRDFVTIYGQRAASDAGRFDERVFAAADAYHALEGDAAPGEGDGSSAVDEGDSEALRRKNARLEEELRITMETMSRMLKEYSTMFAGASDVAAPIAGSLQESPLAAAAVDVDQGQAVIAEPEELKPAAEETDGEGLPDATHPAAAVEAGASDDFAADAVQETSGTRDETDDDGSGAGADPDGLFDKPVDGEELPIAAVRDGQEEPDAALPEAPADAHSADTEAAEAATPSEERAEVTAEDDAPPAAAIDDDGAVELDEALFDVPGGGGDQSAVEADAPGAVELDEALFDVPADGDDQPAVAVDEPGAVELDDTLFDGPDDSGEPTEAEFDQQAAVELDEALFDVPDEPGESTVTETDHGTAIELDEALFDVPDEPGESTDGVSVELDRQLLDEAEEKKWPAAEEAADGKAVDIDEDLFDGLEDFEEVDAVPGEETKRSKASPEKA